MTDLQGALLIAALAFLILTALVIVLYRDRIQYDDMDEIEQDIIEEQKKPPVTRPSTTYGSASSEQLERWAATDLASTRRPQLNNYYMTIGMEYEDGAHPHITQMTCKQWVRIVALDYESARAVAYHFSHGNFASLREEHELRRGYFTDGEFLTLYANSYWRTANISHEEH